MKKLLITSVIASAVVMTGCASDMNKAALGALAGGLGGAAISKGTGGEKTGRDAAIGAAIGAGVGAYMSKQAKQIEQQMAGTGVQVQHDPNTNNINLVMPENITFAYDSATLNPSFTGNLNQLAQTMSQYNQTTITVAGHTDSIGSDSYNYNLSQRRAASVSNYLISRGVSPSRINSVGYGKTRPIADNSTDYGRAQNRRVEITINAPQSL